MGDPPASGPPPKTESQGYSCPDCGKAMSPGYLAVGGRANWVEHEGAFDSRAFKGDNIVGFAEMEAGTAHLKGWRCDECLLMLLEY